jgi:hypothetical protein
MLKLILGKTWKKFIQRIEKILKTFFKNQTNSFLGKLKVTQH